MTRGRILCAMFLWATSFIFIFHDFSEAAHLEKISQSVKKFPESKSAQVIPSSISTSVAPSAQITDQDAFPCFIAIEENIASSLIEPDPGENIGDPVCISYCYTATGSTSATGTGFSGISGTGSNLNFADCDSSFSDPSTLILNPGPSQVIIFSDGPRSGQSFSDNVCNTFQAKIGDTIGASVGAVAIAIKGTGTGQAQTQSSNSFDVELTAGRCPGTAIPTMTEWGMIIFTVLAGLGAIYYISRKRKAES